MKRLTRYPRNGAVSLGSSRSVGGARFRLKYKRRPDGKAGGPFRCSGGGRIANLPGGSSLRSLRWDKHTEPAERGTFILPTGREGGMTRTVRIVRFVTP